MDLSLSPSERELRRELRAWLEESHLEEERIAELALEIEGVEGGTTDIQRI